MAVTQVENSWRATARTAFAVLVSLVTLVPTILVTTDLDATVLGAQVLVVAGAVTKVLALPGVNKFIEDFVPFLAAEPSVGKHSAE
ncbi:hypothetical protein ACH47B_13385 [Rhodococcus sp. NPDC019627]|uniref:hypothetical protein n=1 Tax=unclassified Rhodococcus (in: high G+C Gram-positive bacteria) TaxID=192944 RepID=UPI0033D62F90